jgi:2-polyprenyl-3-methyl-5-hydroxy-6-metoxy-1,4-benzoquinol methylase
MDKSPHWNAQWDRVEGFTPLQGSSIFTNLLDAVAGSDPTPIEGRTAIEIGCFPGQFIEYVGGKGHRISGIDTYPGVVKLNDWMRDRCRLVGAFEQASLADYAASYRGEGFDLVLSLGFVEHFENFCEVLLEHVRLTKLGGRIVIGAPNFATPFQRALHQSLDQRNLANHVLEAMYPSAWAMFLASVGVDIAYSGHLGRFCFWAETQLEDPHRSGLQSMMTRVSPLLSSLGPRFNDSESGYSVVIGTKVRDMTTDRQHTDRVADQVHAMARSVSTRDQSLACQYSSFLERLVEA